MLFRDEREGEKRAVVGDAASVSLTNVNRTELGGAGWGIGVGSGGKKYEVFLRGKTIESTVPSCRPLALHGGELIE